MNTAKEIGSKLNTNNFSNKYQNITNTIKRDVGNIGKSNYFTHGATALKDGATTALGTITTMPGDSTNIEHFHPGIDIANKIGTSIPSFVSGTVTNVRRGMRQNPSGGYGNYVIIKDAEGNNHRYSHLNTVLVKSGDRISQGNTIGLMGNSGATYSTHGGTGAHLDYRVKNSFGKYIDPLKYLTGIYK